MPIYGSPGRSVKQDIVCDVGNLRHGLENMGKNNNRILKIMVILKIFQNIQMALATFVFRHKMIDTIKNNPNVVQATSVVQAMVRLK